MVHYTFYTNQAVLHCVKGFTKQAKPEGESVSSENLVVVRSRRMTFSFLFMKLSNFLCCVVVMLQWPTLLFHCCIYLEDWIKLFLRE